jgi:hypothetical protein
LGPALVAEHHRKCGLHARVVGIDGPIHVDRPVVRSRFFAWIDLTDVGYAHLTCSKVLRNRDGTVDLENVKELHEHCAKNNLVAADGLHFNLAVSSVVPRKRGERNPDVVVVAVDIEHDREIVKSLEVVVASLR